MCSCQQLSGKLNTFHTCVILAMRCGVLLSTVLSLTLCNYICTWLVSVPSADVVFIIELMCSLTRNSIMFVCCGTLHPNSYPKNGCVWAGKPTLSLRNASQQTKPPFVFVHVVFCKAANSNETTPFALKSTVFACQVAANACFISFQPFLQLTWGVYPRWSAMVRSDGLSAFCGHFSSSLTHQRSSSALLGVSGVRFRLV